MSNDRFDKFTERARKVLTLAQEEATRFNHNYIGTEHLLLGLIRERDGVAAKVLTSMGVELNRVRSAVEFIIGRGDRMIVGEVGLTPRAKKVIELAVDEARRLGHHYIGTEHLLLGLVREGEGIAAGVLESVGINLDRVRVQTIQVLGASNAPDGTPAGSLEFGPESEIAAPTEGRSAAPPRWEYLVVQVEYPQCDAGGVVKGVRGGQADRFGQGATPIHEALAVLGAEGWELVAVDMHGSGPAEHYYVLKRMV